MRKDLMQSERGSGFTWKLLALIVVVALLAAMVGAVLSAQVFVKPGPQGLQGDKGDKGDKGDTGDTGAQGPIGAEGPQGPAGIDGSQGLPGTPGINGTDSILQIVQTRNDSTIDTSGFTPMQWFNISDVDASMEITISTQSDSKIFVQFSASQRLEPPAAIWVRVTVDGVYNSSMYVCSTGPPASGSYVMPGHIEFLTDSLSAGLHTVNVQFTRVSATGSLFILDRTLTVTEISA